LLAIFIVHQSNIKNFIRRVTPAQISEGSLASFKPSAKLLLRKWKFVALIRQIESQMMYISGRNSFLFVVLLATKGRVTRKSAALLLFFSEVK
jgi:hypothetical protein